MKAGGDGVIEGTPFRRPKEVKVSKVANWLLLCLIASTGWRLEAQELKAAIILHNGNIVTLDANFFLAEAVAIRANRIAAMGSDAAVLKLAGPTTQLIDLNGRAMIPDLIDTHSHWHNYAHGSYGVNWDDVQRRAK